MKKSWWPIFVLLAFMSGILLGDYERAHQQKPVAEKPLPVVLCSDDGITWAESGPDGMCHPRDVSYTKPIPAAQPPPSLTELFTAGVSSFVMCGYVDDTGLAQPLTAKALRQGRP